MSDDIFLPDGSLAEKDFSSAVEPERTGIRVSSRLKQRFPVHGRQVRLTVSSRREILVPYLEQVKLALADKSIYRFSVNRSVPQRIAGLFDLSVKSAQIFIGTRIREPEIETVPVLSSCDTVLVVVNELMTVFKIKVGTLLECTAFLDTHYLPARLILLNALSGEEYMREHLIRA